MKIYKNIKYIIAVALTAIAVTSCDYDQDYPEVDKPVVTLATSDLSVTEGQEGVIVLNLSRAIGSAVDLKLMRVDGTAGTDEYTVTTAGEYTSPDDGVGPVPAYHVVIPVGATSVEIPVSALFDPEEEGAETINFELSSTGSGMGIVAEDSQNFTVTINNSTEGFYTTLAWAGTYLDAAGVEHEFCDLDLDLEIYTEDFGSIVATSYSSCPEQIVIETGDLEDGTYWIVPSYYSNSGTEAPAEQTFIPASLTFGQAGSSVTATEDLSTLWDYATGGAAAESPDAYYVNYQLVVSGSSFTVTDAEGNVVFEQ